MSEFADSKTPEAHEFDQLLGDPSFVDYMNTFLALPVFSRTITYNREEAIFDIDPPVQRTRYHVIQSRVKSWVRDERMPFFWKTDLYLEYVLCRKLMKGPRTDVPYTPRQITQIIGQVESMRNFRLFLRGTMGERIVSFWLEAERFQRHVKADQKRPAFRELQQKYLKSGSSFELPEIMKWRILCGGSANGSKDTHSRFQQKCYAASSVISSKVFNEVQAMIVDRLRSYWLPKYIFHRALVKKRATQRWRQSIQVKGVEDGSAGRTSVAQVVKEAIENQKREVEKQMIKVTQKEVDELMAESRVSSAESTEDQAPADAEREKQRRLEEWRQWFWGPVDGDQGEMTELPLDGSRINRLDEETKFCAESFPVSTSSTSRVTSEMQTHPAHDKKVPHSTSQTPTASDNRSLLYSASFSLPAQSTSLVCTLERAKSEPAVQPVLVPPGLCLSLERQDYYEDIDDCAQIRQSKLKKEKPVDKDELRLNLPPRPPFAVSLEVSKPMTVYQALVEENDQCEKGRLERNTQNPKHSTSDESSHVTLSPPTLPSLRLPSIHHVKIPKTAYPPHFAEYHKILLNTEAKNQRLLAALTTDSLAGGPFHYYLKRSNNKESLDRLHFWGDVQRFLLPVESLGIIRKHCAANSIIETYLEAGAQRNLGLSPCLSKELVNVLPTGQGDALLLHIAQNVAQLMDLSWSEYTRADEDHFLSSVTVRRKKYANKREKMQPAESSRPGPRTKLPKMHLRALQLALSLTLTGFDYAIDEEDEGEEGEFKYEVPVLKIAKDLLSEVDSKARRSSHFYGRVTKEATDAGDSNRKQSANKSRPPKPRNFQDILSDPVQLLWFKRFLTENNSEIPLLFWQAVEGMKTCKDGKARQARASAVVRKYFVNINTSAVENLQCRADIIREIPVLEKVTPAMLVSAQACVTRSIDEKWFGQYLATFPEEEAEGDNFTKYAMRNTLAGVYKMACHGKTRGLWAMFAHNVMSFQRGIHNTKTLPEFTAFLRREAQATVEQNTRRHALNPTRRMINNKFVNMDRLVSDLEFWLEVERFKALSDNATECARAGNYSLDDERLLHDKAKTIVKCYIDSDFAPRIQINVPNDLAENIVGLLQSGIIERGLFHEAAQSVFTSLIHFWKKFAAELRAEATGGETKPETATPSTGKKSELRKRKVSFISGVPYRKVFLPQEDEVRWMFSLYQGLRLAVPMRLAQRAPARRGDLAPLPSLDGALV